MSTSRRQTLTIIHRLLEAAYGFQGWWPLSGRAGRAGYDAEGYCIDRSAVAPLSNDERVEIALGAILTQNTAWENARRAIASLRSSGLASLEALHSAEQSVLAEAIRASGYFNQKAKKIMLIAEFFARRVADDRSGAPTRAELLAIWGVGPETADSVLLYAYNEPYFVADAYARRVFGRVGVSEGARSYEGLQRICHESLPRDPAVYGEYHALLVRHARTHCLKTPHCEGCPLAAVCEYGMRNG